MVRPIFIKAGTKPNGENPLNGVEKTQSRNAVAAPEPERKTVRTLLNERNDAINKVIRIPDCDDDLAKPKIVSSRQLLPVTSSDDPDIRAREGETVLAMTSLRNQMPHKIAPKSGFAQLPEDIISKRKALSAVKTDNRPLIRPFSNEDPIRSLSSLRDLGTQYEVGPRIVSEPLMNRDQSTIMSDLAFAQRIKNSLGGPFDIVQSSRLNNLVSNMNDLGSPSLNPYGLDLNPLALNALMQEQAFRRNQAQALLQRDRNLIINQALSQQQALHRNIPGLNPGVGQDMSLLDQVGMGQGYNFYPQSLSCKEDLNKNAVSALNYIAKMGKNKRGRPKRNPAEGWPKRPLSAYNIFFKECREKIVGADKGEEDEKEEGNNDPTKPSSRRKRRKKHGKISFGGLAKSVGKMWKELSADQMTYYEQKAEQSREAYRKEIKVFLEERNKSAAEKKKEESNNDDEKA